MIITIDILKNILSLFLIILLIINQFTIYFWKVSGKLFENGKFSETLQTFSFEFVQDSEISSNSGVLLSELHIEHTDIAEYLKGK